MLDIGADFVLSQYFKCKIYELEETVVIIKKYLIS